MKIEELNRIAFIKGVNPYNKSKLQIIREIQIKEGFTPCYGLHNFICPHIECMWREDCMGKIRVVEVI